MNYFTDKINALKVKEKRQHTPMRKIIWVGFACVVVCVIFVVSCNFIVKNSAKGLLYDDVQTIPARKVGLLLGTSPYTAKGTENQYYTNRIEAAVELYFAHKISYILISGDNHRHGYNEPEEMRQSLIAMGVPDSVIYLDYAGFRTFDSMVRAKKVFREDSVTVISQHWHNERAIYIAQHHHLEAIAYNAKEVYYRKAYLKNHTREAAAKSKAVLDVMFHKQPHFLGEYLPIPDSQDTAFKDSIRLFTYPQNDDME